MRNRAGEYLAGEGYAKGPTPTLTERSDLSSGRSGWEGATKGTEKRVREKLGPEMMGSDTHAISGVPWNARVSRKSGVK